ncbi:unnamed protein product [Rhizoctonia solani]|uniref:Uncharacterized protein n=1 Tax=Rhizoctonia solani TaxID=456999 RepID=A0A8H3BV14_9AGAM|nr:unnamed protein product [Rhizoctonia solani]
MHSDMDISRRRIDVEVRNLGLTWRKTSLLTRKKSEKRILSNVNVAFPSGQVTAILGPSGAGKSTLLQLLASRKMNAGVGAGFKSQGDILFNGRPVDKGMREQVAFVEQEDDYHLPALTVRETLRYAAILRLPRTMSRKSKIARAEEVMKMLGLDTCADNLVGGELLKGISGGEKRRLSLAVQVCKYEPTSGLDALTANNVMTALNDIARSGRTIILSIHQPRSDIYVDKLDNIVLLVKGGQVAYAGPRSSVGPTLASAGYPIPPLYNPADWLLDLASVDMRGDRETVTRGRVTKLVGFWAGVHREKQEVKSKEKEEDLLQVGAQENRFTPMWIALPLIVERMTKNLWRQQAVFWVRLQQLPFLGVLFLLFYQRLKHGPTGGQDRIGYFQEMVSPVAFVGLLNCIAIFPKDRDLYFHEYRSSAAYSEATFVLGVSLVALPMEILASLLFTVVTNIGAGMQTSPRIFFEYAFAIFALQSNGESFGIIFACITDSLGLSVSLVSTFITVLVQLSGIISVSIPTWLSDIAYATTMKVFQHYTRGIALITLFQYAARVIAVNESVGLKLSCPTESIQSGECLVQNGQQLLDLLGFSNDLRTSRYLGILVALAVAYRVLAWFFVVLKTRIFIDVNPSSRVDLQRLLLTVNRDQKQMIITKSKPGPRRTSCLTCRKRRKKCDLARPSCDRCLKGGHECLGYNYSEFHEETQRADANIPVPPQLQLGSMTFPASTIGSESVHSSALNREPGHPHSSPPPEDRQYINRKFAGYDPTPSTFESALLHSTARSTPCTNDSNAAMHALEDYNSSWPQHRSQLATPRNGPAHQPLNTTEPLQTVSGTRTDKNYLYTIIQALYKSIPPSVDATQIMREGHFVQIIHEYHLQRAKYWFTAPPSSITISLLQGPKTMIWTMYLGTKLFQALSENTHNTMIPRCIGWIDKLEQNFGNFRSNSPLDGAADWLLPQFELAFLKFTTIGSSSGYLMLRKTLPVFLLLVAIDSNLHVERPSGNLAISFPRTLGAPQHELKLFVIYDTVTSLLLGVLPLVEYDYDGECDSASHGFEWMHGIPVPLIETISKVNSWRAGSRAAPLDDWHNLESHVLAWQPQLAVAEDEEFGVDITVRLAIQEGWRHVTLIYIYMGMCGVSSHDARVQASIRQIIRLGEAVDNLPIGVHVFAHCVVVGLGARYEKHRSFIHDKLLSFKGTRVWLFRGSEFSRVLEHLWHGVGAGGAPVTWDDYARSRSAVLPI